MIYIHYLNFEQEENYRNIFLYIPMVNETHQKNTLMDGYLLMLPFD